MAFITPLPPILSTSTSSSSLCRRNSRITPRRSSFRMSTTPSEEEEVSVPLSALKNYKPDTAAPTEPVAVEEEEEEEDLRSEQQKEIDRLRAAEKFITIDEGNYECSACGYLYEPAKGERQSRIPPGTAFEDLPGSYYCPVCRSPKSRFVSKKKIIAGFADNQKYGFGSNTMTSGQKSALIYGGLLLCFLLLLSGYALN